MKAISEETWMKAARSGFRNPNAAKPTPMVSTISVPTKFCMIVLVGGTLGYLIGGYVVRHHSAENVASGFSFVPVVDVSTHTFGANVALRPDQLDMAKVGRLMNRIRLK
jgi:hypothetical protein